jgi:DNA-binding MurR/RpiR family transcriptional regulator
MDHVALIRRHYDGLTESQKRLADCIISSPDAACLTTTDLAKLADVSQSTVVRFAQTLGYQGYPQLQNDLQEHLIGRLTPSARLKRLRSENVGDLGAYILDAGIGHLESIKPVIHSPEFEQAISLIESAGTVYVIGIRASYSIAHLFAVTLGYIRNNVKLLSNASGAVADEIVHISNKDILVAFSFPKYSILTIKAVNYARSMGCESIALTDSALSPAGRLANIALEIPSTSSSFFTSYTAVVGLINVAIAQLTERQGSGAVESLRQLESLLEDWGHWSE